MKRTLVGIAVGLMIVLCLFVSPDFAKAVGPTIGWEYENSGVTVSPADSIPILGRWTNLDPVSYTLHIQGINSFDYGSFDGYYTIGSEFFGDIVLLANSSVPFQLGTLTPSLTSVPPGTYTTGSVDLVVSYLDSGSLPDGTFTPGPWRGPEFFSATVQSATSPVPEPSTWLLLSLGLAGVGVWRMRRRTVA